MTSTAPPDRTAPTAGAPTAAPGPAHESPAETSATPRVPAWSRLAAFARRPAGRDLGAALAFVAFALWLTAGVWPDPGARVLALNPEDQVLYEWFLANDTRLFRGDFSLLTERLNVPDGVNLMANTTVIALGVVLTPVTLLFGVETTFAVLLGANLALTALAWYLLFARVAQAHRGAALIGGAFCGFAPGMLSQNISHLHMTAQWLVPVMVWCVVRLYRAADPAAQRPVRELIGFGVALGGLVTVQVFIGEEVLFLTALSLLLLTLVYAARRPAVARRAARRFTAGLLVAVAVGVAALAYPLWFQFAGPRAVADGVFDAGYFSADLASWPAISPLSLGGSAEAAKLTTGPAEHNTFLGWPLLLVGAVCAGWLWRRPLALACAVTALVMAGLSLGPEIVLHGERTGISGPYRLLHGLPVVDGALPMRFALPVVPLLAVILVLAVDRALRDPQRILRFAGPAAVLAALLPIVPRPMLTAERPPLPEFITAGHWRACVPSGGVLIPVPLPTPKDPWAMRWAASTNIEFGLPEGFFIGPYGAKGTGSIGTYKQVTSALLADVAATGRVPVINDDQRRQAETDLRFWRASCVALPDSAPNARPLLATLENLLGPGTRVADTWTWRIG
ncbi:MAG TPA: hypothetical protein VES42_21820 [Pilimelia sp.]|nr:hypothetical protein [Pilimelia sp.]